MSWLLKPGSIDHIQHMWQPVERWDTALLHLEVALHDFECLISNKTNYNTLYIERFSWSVKIDDRISLRISKIDGRYGAAYKTKSNEWLYTVAEIDDLYPNEPYVAEPLKRLLNNAHEFFKSYEDNIGYQLGYLYPEAGIVAAAPVPAVLKPNVTTYKFPWIKLEAEIAVAPVIKFLYKDGKPSFMTQDFDHYFFTANPKLMTIDNRPLFIEQPDREKFKALADAREEFNANRAYHSTLAPVETWYETIRRYLNYQVRNSIASSSPDSEAENFVDWYFDLEEKEVQKLKTEKGRKARMDKLDDEIDYLNEHRGSLEIVFRMVAGLKKIRDAVLDLAEAYTLPDSVRQEPQAEGLVVTRNVGNDLMAFKFVPESFSRSNFERND